MKANANDYSALDPVQGQSVRCSSVTTWCTEVVFTSFLSGYSESTGPKTGKSHLCGVRSSNATQRRSMVDGVYWLSLHVQLQYVIAHTKAAFPLPLYSPFSLFARCCSNRTIAERVGSFVRVTDIYIAATLSEWVVLYYNKRSFIYIGKRKGSEKQAWPQIGLTPQPSRQCRE